MRNKSVKLVQVAFFEISCNAMRCLGPTSSPIIRVLAGKLKLIWVKVDFVIVVLGSRKTVRKQNRMNYVTEFPMIRNLVVA